ncbi:hypothetical protein ACF3MZ_09575 [Paenibacillaceae bacterium WGS1546]|uniref:hypothetical protein n=1 Tax=Cohnella sp. WGS1546 TaxID=3366810 RepID=UPI00372D0B7E
MRKKTSAALLLALLTAMALTACASSPQAGEQDPRDIKVDLRTDPAPARAGEPTKLTAVVEGLLDEKNTIVQLEIRRPDHSGLPELIEEVEYEGDGLYSAPYAFNDGMTYDVYVHIYKGELHVTKKRPVEVEP